MNLSLPTPTVTLGPAWATQLNTALGLVDSHDHSDGKGTRVKTAGLTIDADLSFAGFRATLLKALALDAQGSTLSGLSFAQNVYTYNGDLYWTNSTGTVVQITAGGTLAAVAGATDTIEFETVTGDVTLTAANKVIQAVNSTSASIEVTLPAAGTLTGGRLFVIKDVSGNSETYPITVATTGVDTIDGENSLVIDSNFGATFLYSDGNANWYSI
jgi:hypothetical protein